MFQPLQALDERVFRLINGALVNPVCDWFFPLLNHAAPFVPLLMLGLGWVAYCNSRRAWLVALGLVLGVAMGDGLVFNPLKQIIARPRPAASHTDVRALASGAGGGYSFPSSHTANAFLIAAVLCSCVGRFSLKLRASILTMAAGVGLARVYVGVHYPSDIVGSALLGWFLGRAGWRAGQGAWRRLRRDAPDGAAPSEDAIASIAATSRTIPQWFGAGWFPCLVLAGVQVLRLIWAAGASLDAPPDAVRLWCLVHADENVFPRVIASNAAWNGVLFWFGRLWFGLFGAGSLSLWAIPWTLQSVWQAALAWMLWRRHPSSVDADPPRLAALWGVVVLSLFVPLVSQLSFLGSPAQAFAEADWSATAPLQALVFYSIIASPLWIGTALCFRGHPWASFSAIAGWILAVSFPSLGWCAPALASSGVMFFMAKRIGMFLRVFEQPQSARWRFAFALLIMYGAVVGTAVYNPRFLRKLDVSLLPRNNPHYIQTGWRSWAAQIRPILGTASREIWTDSALSRDQLQYLMGNRFRVRAPEDLATGAGVPSKGAWYVREVYLAQINPRVLFVRRRDWLPEELRRGMREMKSTEIFYRQDPIRQFQLYEIPAP
ncbi:MAG: phosphatase PAP2 family protein [Verrucomicrobia bacterium]|nr:phosphatase PAP2 family protein [Verrucomicrobiota bacterium]